MRGKSFRFLSLMAVLATVLTAALLLGWPQSLIEVWVEGENSPRLIVPIARETGFSIWFLHSYDRAFFEEYYRLEEAGRIVLTRMRFKSCLNGQGFGSGTYRSLSDGSAELNDINRAMDFVFFRLGSPDLANHTLVVGKKRMRLLDHASPGDMIVIRSTRKPRLSACMEGQTPERKAFRP